MNSMIKVFNILEKILHFFLAMLFVGMSLFVIIQVTARYVFHNPLTWTEELVRYIFVWSVMAGAVAAMAKGKHLCVDLLNQKLPPRGKLIHDTIIRIVVFGYLICLAIGGFTLLGQTATQLSATMRISMAIPISAIPICASIMAVQEIYFIIQNIKGLRRKEVM